MNLYITNDGLEGLSNLGIYIQPAADLGTWAMKSNRTPESDYYDILELGDAVVNETSVSGGVTINSDTEIRVTSTAGCSAITKIGDFHLNPAETRIVEIKFYSPDVPVVRNFYFDVVVE